MKKIVREKKRHFSWVSLRKNEEREESQYLLTLSVSFSLAPVFPPSSFCRKFVTHRSCFQSPHAAIAPFEKWVQFFFLSLSLLQSLPRLESIFLQRRLQFLPEWWKHRKAWEGEKKKAFSSEWEIRACWLAFYMTQIFSRWLFNSIARFSSRAKLFRGDGKSDDGESIFSRSQKFISGLFFSFSFLKAFVIPRRATYSSLAWPDFFSVSVR